MIIMCKMVVTIVTMCFGGMSMIRAMSFFVRVVRQLDPLVYLRRWRKEGRGNCGMLGLKTVRYGLAVRAASGGKDYKVGLS